MPIRNDTTATGWLPGADPVEAAPVNRSPRAQPLPETEWCPETTPPEQRPDFFPERKPPRVLLAYPQAKRHFGR